MMYLLYSQLSLDSEGESLLFLLGRGRASIPMIWMLGCLVYAPLVTEQQSPGAQLIFSITIYLFYLRGDNQIKSFSSYLHFYQFPKLRTNTYNYTNNCPQLFIIVKQFPPFLVCTFFPINIIKYTRMNNQRLDQDIDKTVKIVIQEEIKPLNQSIQNHQIKELETDVIESQNIQLVERSIKIGFNKQSTEIGIQNIKQLQKSIQYHQNEQVQKVEKRTQQQSIKIDQAILPLRQSQESIHKLHIPKHQPLKDQQPFHSSESKHFTKNMKIIQKSSDELTSLREQYNLQILFYEKKVRELQLKIVMLETQLKQEGFKNQSLQKDNRDISLKCQQYHELSDRQANQILLAQRQKIQWNVFTDKLRILEQKQQETQQQISKQHLLIEQNVQAIAPDNHMEYERISQGYRNFTEEFKSKLQQVQQSHQAILTQKQQQKAQTQKRYQELLAQNSQHFKQYCSTLNSERSDSNRLFRYFQKRIAASFDCLLVHEEIIAGLNGKLVKEIIDNMGSKRRICQLEIIGMMKKMQLSQNLEQLNRKTIQIDQIYQAHSKVIQQLQSFHRTELIHYQNTIRQLKSRQKEQLAQIVSNYQTALFQKQTQLTQSQQTIQSLEDRLANERKQNEDNLLTKQGERLKLVLQMTSLQQDLDICKLHLQKKSQQIVQVSQFYNEIDSRQKDQLQLLRSQSNQNQLKSQEYFRKLEIIKTLMENFQQSDYFTLELKDQSIPQAQLLINIFERYVFKIRELSLTGQNLQVQNTVNREELLRKQQQINELTAKIEVIIQIKANLQSSLADCQARLDQNEKLRFQQQITKLQAKVNGIQRSLSMKNRELSAMEMRLQQKEVQLQANHQTIAKIRSQLQRIQYQYEQSKLQVQFFQSHPSNEALFQPQRSNKSVQVQTYKYQQMQKDNGQIGQKLKEQLLNLQKKYARLEQEKRHLKEQISELIKIQTIQKSTQKATTSQNAQLKRLNNELRERVEILSTKRQSNESSNYYEEMYNNLREEFDLQQQELASIKQKYEELKVESMRAYKSPKRELLGQKQNMVGISISPLFFTMNSFMEMYVPGSKEFLVKSIENYSKSKIGKIILLFKMDDNNKNIFHSYFGNNELILGVFVFLFKKKNSLFGFVTLDQRIKGAPACFMFSLNKSKCYYQISQKIQNLAFKFQYSCLYFGNQAKFKSGYKNLMFSDTTSKKYFEKFSKSQLVGEQYAKIDPIEVDGFEIHQINLVP